MKKRNLTTAFLLLFCTLIYGQIGTTPITTLPPPGSTAPRPESLVECLITFIDIDTGKELVDGKCYPYSGLVQKGIDGKIFSWKWDLLTIQDIGSIQVPTLYSKNILPAIPSGWILISSEYSARPKPAKYTFYFQHHTKYNGGKILITNRDNKTNQTLEGSGIIMIDSSDKPELYYTPAYIPDNFRTIDHGYTISNYEAPIGYKKSTQKFNVAIPNSPYTFLNERDIVPLHYKEKISGQFKDVGDYEAVRIGEYLWMNSAFRDEVLKDPTAQKTEKGIENWEKKKSFTQAQINLWYDRAWMFMGSNKDDKCDYFTQIGGANINEKLKLINQYYGTYHLRTHIDYLFWWGPHAEEYEPHNVRIKLLEGSNTTHNGWNHPTETEMRQLIAMCGNGTRDEMRLYLSPQYIEGANNPPLVIEKKSYMSWFDRTIHNDIKNLANPVEDLSRVFNRYGFNMYPTGERLNANDDITLKNHDTGQSVTYTNTVQGDFRGFNQQSTIPLGDAHFILHDYPEIKFDEYNANGTLKEKGKSFHWLPIRWCRRLTTEELGYELYINVPNFTETYNNLVALYQNHINGTKVIEIMKKTGTTMNECPDGYKRLPNGLLRGFYVQYMMQFPESHPDKAKTIEDILKIAQESQKAYLFPKPRPKKVILKNAEAVANIENVEETTLNIYPNPVKDVLFIDSSNDIESVHIFNAYGKLSFTEKNIENSVNLSSLPSGVYIVKINSGEKTQTFRIIKE